MGACYPSGVNLFGLAKILGVLNLFSGLRAISERSCFCFCYVCWLLSAESRVFGSNLKFNAISRFISSIAALFTELSWKKIERKTAKDSDILPNVQSNDKGPFNI